ncbi:MAG TPA: M42 family metallopeptidase [Synergistaceae bacterium]|nr:M42 family metallopeptidase [Synergistaceae bacterium]
MTIDMPFVEKFLLELLAIPSVPGDCEAAAERVRKEFDALGLSWRTTPKGAVVGVWPGQEAGDERLVSAHVDTLGAVVRQIKSTGRLKLLPIGGFAWGAMEGENLLVRTADGREFSGSLLPEKASIHAFSETVREAPRNDDTVEVRLDAPVSCKEDVEKLGIAPGDFVFFDPRPVITGEGFIKARFLDDKASVACLFGALRAMKAQGLSPRKTTHFYISNHEEIGHGVARVPDAVTEFVALDIGIVAEGTESSEHCVTIAARDSRSPYHLPLRRRLTSLARERGIDFRTDVFYRYGSDATIAVLQGADVAFACFGPGVDATHHYERTHRKALEETARLLVAYLTA